MQPSKEKRRESVPSEKVPALAGCGSSHTSSLLKESSYLSALSSF